jgi:hypothetical protein
MALPILLTRFSWVNENLPASQLELEPFDLWDNHFFFQEFR